MTDGRGEMLIQNQLCSIASIHRLAHMSSRAADEETSAAATKFCAAASAAAGAVRHPQIMQSQTF
jgi:hypothetical protein